MAFPEMLVSRWSPELADEDATTILAIYIGRRATTTYKRS